VLIPIPVATADPEPFTQETLSALAVGRTTPDEVRALFADWNFTTDDGVVTAHIEPQISDDGRYWAFGLPRQMGDVAFAGLVMYFPGPLPVLMDVEDNYQNYWVLTEFDEAGLVSAWWIAREQGPCTRGGVCYRSGRLLVLADEVANAAALVNAPPRDRCVVYTYAQADFGVPATVSDGSGAGLVFDKTTFLRTDSTAGRLTLSVSLEGSGEAASDASVACVGGDTHYVELRRIKKQLVAVQADAKTGGREVAKRFLVERIVPVSAPGPTPEVEPSDLNLVVAPPVSWPPLEPADG
jgi:hypothetical protein